MRYLVDKSDTVYFPNKKAEHRKDWNIQAKHEPVSIGIRSQGFIYFIGK